MESALTSHGSSKQPLNVNSLYTLNDDSNALHDGIYLMQPEMSLEAGNRRKSPVTLAVTASYFFNSSQYSLKKIEKKREYVTRIIQSLSVYNFISGERKITTDIIWIRGYVMMFICKDLQT
jgi:hypothetical protein